MVEVAASEADAIRALTVPVRVVSLLPAATEIVAALGRAEWLVGVSRECDYPLEVKSRPRVTRCEIYGKVSISRGRDRWFQGA